MSHATSAQTNGSTPAATTPPAKPKTRQPDTLTPEAAAFVVHAIAVGASVAVAAQAAGVPPWVLRAWNRRGRLQKKGPYRGLRRAMLQAKGTAAAARLELIRAAGEAGDWKAAAWWLERMCQEDYGDQRHAIAEIKKGQREIMDHVKKSRTAT